MAGLCEGGNEPPGSLRANAVLCTSNPSLRIRRIRLDTATVTDSLKYTAHRTPVFPVAVFLTSNSSLEG
ncbi:hypothetical protein ANN_18149 [Periplaneta americana]|uniref:Uncharacterized protein n=1 Tax=Periplaneta americana TaxID=6978 RepID=A0ABQ8SNG0_PERAM|nr:hypothetical protein ANN_18149 [Periplaneta americana]